MKHLRDFVEGKMERGLMTRLMEEITSGGLNEMGPKTYALLHNSTTNARNHIQLGMQTKTKRGRTVSRYNDIERANAMDGRAKENFMKPYIGKTFAFFGRTRTQLVANVTFTFDELVQLDFKKAILKGGVTFNDNSLNGDIIYEFSNNTAYYKDKQSKYKYTLEPNNNVRALWDRLIKDLKATLAERR